MQHYTKQVKSPLLQLLCVSLVVMWGQGTEATASLQPLKEATFEMLPVSDVMFTEDVLWEKPAWSRMECSVMCMVDAQCLMFTFRPAKDGPAGSCRSHRKQHTAQGMKESAPEARSFMLVREVCIQKPYNTNSDCRKPLTACYSGQCLCDGGLFFDHTDNTCVKTCTRGFADTYLEYRGWDLMDHDIHTTYHEGIPTCKANCRRDPACLIFAEKDGGCYFKGATAQNFPGDWKEGTGVTSFQKTCV